MALVGRLHPLLVHFPIALVLTAAAAEAAALLSGDRRWRVVAIGNVRVAALFAAATAVAGWRLATAPGVDQTPMLGWHRWLGTLAAVVITVVAVGTSGDRSRSERAIWLYRLGLAAAALLVALTGHLGGLLVWGADFLRS